MNEILYWSCSSAVLFYITYLWGPGPSLGGVALCQEPHTPKGPRTTAVIAATDDGSVDQSNQFISLCGMKYCHNLNSTGEAEI